MGKAKNIKGIDSPLYVFGIRGDLIVIWIGVSSLVALVLMVFLAMLMMKKYFAYAGLILVLFFASLALVYYIFFLLSKTRPFKRLEKQPDMVVNQDLMKLNKYKRW